LSLFVGYDSNLLGEGKKIEQYQIKATPTVSGRWSRIKISKEEEINFKL
jgi:hypothetical protein